jgi:transcriptional regulator with XRE-family HTH domain
MSDIGNRIKLQLRSSGMSQKELAKRTGITEISLSRYINGIRTPRTDIAIKIAEALGCSCAYILIGDETTQNKDDSEKDFYKVLQIVAKSADKWNDNQKIELIYALMGVIDR